MTDEAVRPRAMREASIFFALTFAISWGSGGLFLAFHTRMEPLFGRFGPHNAIFFLAAYAPTISAIVLSLVFAGGLGELFARLVRPVRPLWIVVAVLIIPALALSLGAMPSLGLGAPPDSSCRIVTALPLALFATPLILTNTGPLGEELGWRGFALPRLLQFEIPLTAAIVLGLVWTLWHVPAFFISGVMGQSFAGFGWWALDTVALSIVVTWLYLHANGNVAVAGIIPHFVINGMGVTGTWLSRPPEAGVLALFAVCVVAFDAETMLRIPAPRAKD
jgi:membrane protease YdiL (CAAX protease family)